MEDGQVRFYLQAALYLVAFVVGLDSSRWLTKRYNNAKAQIDEPNRLVLRVIVIASWMITAASGWIGFISVLRLMADVILPWTPPITLAVATAIVFIPLMFRLAIRRVARDQG